MNQSDKSTTSISYFPVHTLDPRQLHQGFMPWHVYKPSDFDKITKYPWSPVTWANGIRQKAKFLRADFVSLDIDSGSPSIEECIRRVRQRDLFAVIGTTKSHQIEKGGHAACDRYRLVLKWEVPIHDIQVYEANTKSVIQEWNADPACNDGARFFFPCKEIVFTQDGRSIRWNKISDRHILHDKRWQDRKSNLNKLCRATRSLPRFISDLLRNGHPLGARHKKTYHAAATLTELGYSELNARQLILDSPLAAIGTDDVTRAVRNAYKKIAGG